MTHNDFGRRTFVKAVGAGALVASSGMASAAKPPATRFKTHLTGDEEVPDPVDTKAQGQANFKLSKDGTEMSYRLNVANIEDVTMAHIHNAPAGENGGIVAWLYPDAPPMQLIPGRTNGVLAEGTIVKDDLIGPLAGMQLSALLEEMRAGNTYVNVHTTQHPGGEIRGQIS